MQIYCYLLISICLVKETFCEKSSSSTQFIKPEMSTKNQTKFFEELHSFAETLVRPVVLFTFFARYLCVSKSKLNR